MMVALKCQMIGSVFRRFLSSVKIFKKKMFGIFGRNFPEVFSSFNDTVKKWGLRELRGEVRGGGGGWSR